MHLLDTLVLQNMHLLVSTSNLWTVLVSHSPANPPLHAVVEHGVLEHRETALDGQPLLHRLLMHLCHNGEQTCQLLICERPCLRRRPTSCISSLVVTDALHVAAGHMATFEVFTVPATLRDTGRLVMAKHPLARRTVLSQTHCSSCQLILHTNIAPY